MCVGQKDYFCYQAVGRLVEYVKVRVSVVIIT